MSRSTSWETELCEVWSCKWLGSSIIAKLWLKNDPTVEDGMLAWSECLGLCREVRFSAKEELPRRSSMDIFSLLKRWGVKELYFKPTDVSGVRDGGIEEGSDVKLGWITVFCAKIFQPAVGTFVRGDSGRSSEIFQFSSASENADDTLGKQQSLLALKNLMSSCACSIGFCFLLFLLSAFLFRGPQTVFLISLALWGFFFPFWVCQYHSLFSSSSFELWCHQQFLCLSMCRIYLWYHSFSFLCLTAAPCQEKDSVPHCCHFAALLHFSTCPCSPWGQLCCLW